MTDGKYMRTSEITALLRHNSPAVTRAWIRKHQLKAEARETETGEKKYLRDKVEEAIRDSVRRGPYRRGDRPDGDEPPRHEHRPPGSGD